MTEQLHPRSELNGKPPVTTSWNGSITEAGTEMRSYYGRPIVKEPVWTWEIPTYFFTGGLAGASSVLSSAAKVSGNETLARRALYIGALADLVSPALLITKPAWAVVLVKTIPKSRLAGATTNCAGCSARM